MNRQQFSEQAIPKALLIVHERDKLGSVMVRSFFVCSDVAIGFKKSFKRTLMRTTHNSNNV